MNTKGPLFYSKILLFGEYGIIKNSKGLSIPYNFFNGALKSNTDLEGTAKESNKSLEKLFKENGFKITKKIKSNVSMKQIDYEYSNIFIKYFLYLGLSIIIKTENFFNKSWLQTVIFTKKN